MSSEPLPTDVQAFLRERVRSFEDLGTLLLVREHRSETWSAERVASKLSLSPEAAQEALDHLSAQKLLDARSGGEGLRFQYNPGTPDLQETIERLVLEYEDNRIEVLKVMSSQAIERVRTSVLNTFADAFLLGRKK